MSTKFKILFRGEIEIEANSEDDALFLFNENVSKQEILNAIERVDFDNWKG